MISFSKHRIDELFSRFRDQKIAVIGDLMLDCYLWGQVSRISPEAPVPVVDIENESYRFGGAANVTYNVTALGAQVLPVGIIGEDANGEMLKALFQEKNFPTEGLMTDPGRPTTVKTRIIAHNQQVVRTDREVREDIPGALADRILAYLDSHMDDTSAIVMEDYNKGMMTRRLIKGVIDLARRHDIPVLVDPKFDNFFTYKDVTVFKPNRKEASERLGMRISTPEDVDNAGRLLLDRLNCRAVLLTLGEHGMALFERDKEPAVIPTKAQEVHDVSGAGDTVIAALSAVISSGGNCREAATVANHAAGIVCGQVGIVPVDRERLYNELADEAEE